jgi:O-antigen/teichoic acid export membrane protein
MLGKFFKNAGILVITELFLRFKGLIVIPLLTRHFGTISYGIWSQVNVVVSTLTPLVVLGTDSALIRYLPGRPLSEQKRRFTAWLLFLSAVTLAAVSLLFIFQRPVTTLFFGDSGDCGRFIPLVACTLWVTILLNVARSWFRVHNDAKIYSQVSLAQALLGLLAIVAMLMLKKNVYELVLYTLLGDLLVVAALFIRITFSFGWERPELSVVRQLLAFGLPLVPAGYAMWGLNYMDRLFLVRYSTLSELGIYALVYNLGYLVIQTLVNPLWLMYPNSVTELYNSEDYAGVQKLFDHTAGVICALTIPAIMGLFVLGRQLLLLLSTPEFAAGAPLIAIIASAYFFHMIASFFDTSFGLIHRQYLAVLSMVVALIVNLLLNMVLIPAYSITGAAFATMLAFLAQLLFSCAVSVRLKTLTVNFAFFFRILLLSSLMALGVHGLAAAFFHQGIIDLLILILAGVLFYALLLILFRIVSTADIARALRRLAPAHKE